jgi:hypothetical protein
MTNASIDTYKNDIAKYGNSPIIALSAILSRQKAFHLFFSKCTETIFQIITHTAEYSRTTAA